MHVQFFFAGFCQKNKMGSNSREWCSFPDLRFLKAMMLVLGNGGYGESSKKSGGGRKECVWLCKFYIWIWLYINIVCIIIIMLYTAFTLLLVFFLLHAIPILTTNAK